MPQLERAPETSPLGLNNSGARVTELQQTLYAYGLSNKKPDGLFGPETKAAVERLQMLLNQMGLTSPQGRTLRVDGIFGEDTNFALHQLFGLIDEKGIVGQIQVLSRPGPDNLLNVISTNTVGAGILLGVGVRGRGQEVTELQTMLESMALLGKDTPNGAFESGIFDKPTENAVILLQIYLNEQRSVFTGDAAQAPYAAIRVDGKWGPETSAALVKYVQALENLNPFVDNR